MGALKAKAAQHISSHYRLCFPICSSELKWNDGKAETGRVMTAAWQHRPLRAAQISSVPWMVLLECRASRFQNNIWVGRNLLEVFWSNPFAHRRAPAGPGQPCWLPSLFCWASDCCSYFRCMYTFSCTDSGLVNNAYCRWETPKDPSTLTTLLNNIEKNKKMRANESNSWNWA